MDLPTTVTTVAPPDATLELERAEGKGLSLKPRLSPAGSKGTGLSRPTAAAELLLGWTDPTVPEPVEPGPQLLVVLKQRNLPLHLDPITAGDPRQHHLPYFLNKLSFNLQLRKI